MRNKGRILVGVDADLTIFNPRTIIDKATYTQPAQHSEGIEYVIVNGTPVVAKGKLDSAVFSGEPVRVM
ncbi:MAG: hypothetical protein CMQ21_06125 [Gammaproteobacteria bacterium]|jgi:N-acyl-D-aspartate/D-glutamate deacylase|nr:hypothetical protein [Gammaproteobacteria bacterium]